MAPEGARLGVAVSGGADSVFLLEALLRLGYSLHVIHVNHQLRGEESEADERFVRRLAASRGLAVSVLCADPPRQGGNLEHELRRIRYTFFQQVRREHRLERIATGHTRSDQAETVLMRLARGSAGRGLSGIHPVTREGVIRPLLEVGRDEIREWLSVHGMAWREDSTNRDPRWLRNRVRREVLPVLATVLNPQVEQALARMASLAWEDEQDWERRVKEEFEKLGQPEPPFVLPVDTLRRMGPALARRLLRRLLVTAAGRAAGLDWDHLDSAWRLAAGAAGEGKLTVPGARVWRSLDWIRIEAGPFTAPRPPEPVLLPAPGEVRFGAWRVAAGYCGEQAQPDGYNEVSELAAGAAGFPLTVRGWRPGDRFHAAGRSGPLKVKDLFQCVRVPSWERVEWPMVESGGRLVWCRGFGAAAGASPGPGAPARIWIAARRE